MRTFTTLFLLAALLAAAPAALPAQTMRLTLEEAVRLGLANATSVQSRTLGIEQARQDVASARAGYYPQASASLGWTHLFEQPEASFGGPAIPTAPTDPVSLSLQLSQPLYTFGRLRTGVALAENGVASAQLSLEQERWVLAGRIERAFYGFLLARQALLIQQQTLQARQEALEVARRKFQVGVASDYEVLQAEADLESFRPTLIGAANQVDLALITVKNLLNLPSGEAGGVELVGSLEVAPATEPDRQALVSRALAERFEARSLRQGQQAAALQERLARQAFYPSIGGFLNYSLSSGMDDDGDNLYWGEGSWDGNLSGGLSLSVPLSAWLPISAERAGRRRAQLAQQDLTLGLKALEGQVQLQVDSALLAIREQQQRLRSSETNITLARRLYDSAREQYARGVISSLELQNALLGLNGAQLGQLQSQYNYRLALLDLRDAVGGSAAAAAPAAGGTDAAGTPSTPAAPAGPAQDK